jgi:hypothetical protein
MPRSVTVCTSCCSYISAQSGRCGFNSTGSSASKPFAAVGAVNFALNKSANPAEVIDVEPKSTSSAKCTSNPIGTRIFYL